MVGTCRYVDRGGRVLRPRDRPDPATLIGKGRELGSIEPGKIADVIVVNGNPLFDITALSHVEIVMKDGKIYKGGPAPDAKRSSR